MARHRKLRGRKLKKQKRIILASIIGLTLILSTGYAAFSTNLTLNAKGNVKYVAKISPSDLTAPENIKPSTSTDDGLYADPEENGRYIFKGADPDNYITIGDEEYRIMSIESDGTLKVIKNDKIDSVWDPGYETSIAGVTEANNMTGTRWSSTSTDYCYYNSSETTYYGCNVWSKQLADKTITEGVMLDSAGSPISVMPRQVGSSSTYTLPETDSYVNTYLNTTYLNALLTKMDTNKREYIEEHTFNIGPVANTANQTLATDISQEAAYKWNGKVGLMTATEYVKASTNSACTSVRDYYNTSGCYSNSTTPNFLAKSYTQWTMSPYSHSSSRYVWGVTSAGRLSSYDARASYGVRPVLYLSSDIQLKGEGTQSKPYQIA